MSATDDPAAREIDRVEDEAAEWLVRRDAGFSAAEAAAFDAWLAADPRHPAAFAEMEAGLDLLDRPGDLGLEQRVLAKIDLDEPRGRSWWRQNPGWIGVATAAAVAWLIWVAVEPAPWSRPAPAQTVASVVQPEQRILPDTSVVELNRGGDIRIDFQSTRRDVELLQGEAHFSVAKDPARPFVVAAGPVRVQAVGTAFAVRREAAAVEVLVTEGTVTVSPTEGGSGALVVLEAGHRTVIDLASAEQPAVAAVTPEEIRRQLAWRVPRFELSQAPLGEAVELFNRTSTVKLAVADPTLAAEKVSGIYWAESPDGFARLIAGSLDLEVIREAEDRIVLRRRP